MVKVFQVSESSKFAFVERLGALSGCGCLALSAVQFHQLLCYVWRCTFGVRGWLPQLHSQHREVAATFSACLSVSRMLQAFEAGAVYCLLKCIPSGALLFISVLDTPSIQSLM